MNYFYLISIKDAEGKMQRYGIVAPTKAKAEAEACRLAGVPVDTDPETFQKIDVCHSVVA